MYLCNPMNCSPPNSSVHGDAPDKNTGEGCHALLQGLFLTQGQTQVSHIAGRFFTAWATREAPPRDLQLVINYPLILSYTFTIDVLRGPYNYGKRVWESKRITTRGRVAAGVIEKEHIGASKVLVTFYALGWVVDTQLLSFTSYTPCLSSFCLTAYKAMANWIHKTELDKCPQSSKLPRCLAKSPETHNNSVFSSLFKLENSERKKKKKEISERDHCKRAWYPLKDA